MNDVLIQYITMLVGVVILIYITNWFISIFFRNRLAENEGPLSFSIHKGGILLMMILLYSKMTESVPALIKVLRMQESDLSFTLRFLMYFSIFLALVFALGLFISWLTRIMYLLVGDNKNFSEETAENNLGADIVSTAILIGIAIIGMQSITALIDLIIPYPEVPRFF